MRKTVNALLGFALGLMLALGTAGAFRSGFGLPLKESGQVVLSWVLAAALGAAAFSAKRGGLALFALGALVGGYLWRQGALLEELAHLVHRISYVYDQAYGWGYLPLTDRPWNAGAADLPLALMGGAMALLGTWTVCRSGTATWAVGFSLACLAPCLVVTDTVPEPIYLYLLLLADILLLLTGRVRREDPYQGDRLTLLTALPTALALGLLFWAMPQKGYVNKSAELRENVLSWIQEMSTERETGFQSPLDLHYLREPEQVNLAAIGKWRPDAAPVMTVTAQAGGALYLRGQDYDVYDGRGWTASDRRVERLEYAGVDLGPVTIEARSPLGQTYLPYYPRGGVSLIGGRVENTRLEQAYTISRLGLPDGWLSLSAPPADVPESGGRYLELPEAARTGAENLLPPIPEGATAWEQAQAIAAVVRDSARYDRDPGRMPEGEEDFALWFLRDSDRGYCVHFATAATVLLRAAGIPARYVSGYMLPARSGKTVTVTGENAHAWAEYYDPGLNAWMVLEATPGEGLPAAPVREPETVPTTAPPETTAPTTETARPPQTTEPETFPAASADAPAQGPVPEAPKQYLPWLGTLLRVLLGTAAGIAALEGQFRFRVRLRRRRESRGPANARALILWRAAERLARLLKQEPPKNLEALANKAKFSQHTLTKEELEAFGHYLAGAKSALKTGPWYSRILCRYIFAID